MYYNLTYVCTYYVIIMISIDLLHDKCSKHATKMVIKKINSKISRDILQD